MGSTLPVNSALAMTLAKKTKPKPKPKPDPPAQQPDDGLDWVRQGAAIRQGLDRPTQFGGKGFLRASWDETGRPGQPQAPMPPAPRPGGKKKRGYVA